MDTLFDKRDRHFTVFPTFLNAITLRKVDFIGYIFVSTKNIMPVLCSITHCKTGTLHITHASVAGHA